VAAVGAGAPHARRDLAEAGRDEDDRPRRQARGRARAPPELRGATNRPTPGDRRAAVSTSTFPARKDDLRAPVDSVLVEAVVRLRVVRSPRKSCACAPDRDDDVRSEPDGGSCPCADRARKSSPGSVASSSTSVSECARGARRTRGSSRAGSRARPPFGIFEKSSLPIVL